MEEEGCQPSCDSSCKLGSEGNFSLQESPTWISIRKIRIWLHSQQVDDHDLYVYMHLVHGVHAEQAMQSAPNAIHPPSLLYCCMQHQCFISHVSAVAQSSSVYNWLWGLLSLFLPHGVALPASLLCLQVWNSTFPVYHKNAIKIIISWTLPTQPCFS